MMETACIRPRPLIGYLSFAIGSLALLLVLVHFWVGPLAPQQRASVTVGEIRRSAIRKLKGQAQPAPVARPWDIDRILKLVVALLAGVAVIAGAASLVRRETWRPAAAGAALGIGAIAFQLFTWTILILIGGLLLYAIINNMSDILGG